MKQNITIEQLEELSDKGKERLEVWIENKLPPSIPGSASIGPLSSPHQTCYFMTIGQMIEFLDEHDHMIINIRRGWDAKHKKAIWVYKGNIRNAELCDALWEPVKKILNGVEKN